MDLDLDLHYLPPENKNMGYDTLLKKYNVLIFKTVNLRLNLIVLYLYSTLVFMYGSFLDK